MVPTGWWVALTVSSLTQGESSPVPLWNITVQQNGSKVNARRSVEGAFKRSDCYIRKRKALILGFDSFRDSRPSQTTRTWVRVPAALRCCRLGARTRLSAKCPASSGWAFLCPFISFGLRLGDLDSQQTGVHEKGRIYSLLIRHKVDHLTNQHPPKSPASTRRGSYVSAAA